MTERAVFLSRWESTDLSFCGNGMIAGVHKILALFKSSQNEFSFFVFCTASPG